MIPATSSPTDTLAALAQPAIFVTGTRVHWIGELTLADAADPAELAAALAATRAELGTNTVMAVGPDLWPRLFDVPAPADHHPLLARTGVTGRSMPAAQADLFVWLHGDASDRLMTDVLALRRGLGPLLELRSERWGYTYLESQDLTGFEDGTENPPIEEAPEVALIPDGPLAGASHVLGQTWRHDLDGFHRLDVAGQEAVIGRTKEGSIELDEVPEDSHLGRVVIEEDGEELEIWRRSVPWGGYDEHGLYFLAFSADPHRFEAMLDAMFAVDAPPHDRLTDFSTPTTGARYLAPPVALLDALG